MQTKLFKHLLVLATLVMTSLPSMAKIASGTDGTCNWVIDDNGLLTVSPTTGDEGTLTNWGYHAPWGAWEKSIRKVQFSGTIIAKTCGYMFASCKYLESVDLTGLNTSNCTDFCGMFWVCESLTSVDLRGLDFSKANNFENMFQKCTALTSVEMNWDLPSTEILTRMFMECKSLKSLDLSGLNAPNLSDMSFFCYDCTALEELDITGLTIPAKKYSTANDLCFYNCSQLKRITSRSAAPNFKGSNVFRQLNTSSHTLYIPKGAMENYRKVDDTYYFNKVELSDIGVSGDCMWEIDADGTLTISGGSTTSTLGTWTTAAEVPWYDIREQIKSVKFVGNITAQTCLSMFTGCTNLTSIDLTPLNTSSVTDMSAMFQNCTSLTTLDLTPLNTSNVTNMAHMFQGCTGLTTMTLDGFTTGEYANVANMFTGCTELGNLYVRDTTTPPTLNSSTFSTLPLRSTAVLWVPQSAYNNYRTATGWSALNVKYSYTGTSGTCTWLLDNEGNLTVSPTTGDEGTLGSWAVLGKAPWDSYSKHIQSVSFTGTIHAVTCSHLFYGCTNLTSVNLTNLDTENVTHFTMMFAYCTSLKTLDLTPLNTSSATSMEAMFRSCRSLTTIDLAPLNTEKVTNMGSMFQGCTGLTSLDLSPLNTSKVTNMGSLFNECTGLTSLDLSNFNTESVTSMGGMFGNCTGLTSLDLTPLNTSKVTNMYHMFVNCSNLAYLNLTGFTTANVTSMTEMFTGCSKLYNITSGNATPSTLQSGTFSTLTTASQCTLRVPATATDAYAAATGWNELGIIKGATAGISGTCIWEIDGDGNLVVSPTEGDEGTLDIWNYNAPWYDYASSIKTASFTGTIHAATCRNFFASCNNLTSVDLTGLNTSEVKNMSYMFSNCKSLTSLDLTSLNTSMVTNMEGMFQYCYSLTTLNISNFDTRNVTRMYGMFYDCRVLTSLNLSSFNTSKVTTMFAMFMYCRAVTSLDLSSFDFRKVTDMSRMFGYCNALTSLNLTTFQMNKVQSGKYPYIFTGCNLLTDITNETLNPDDSLWDDVFSTLPTLSTCTLHVPYEGMGYYSKRNGWKNFTNIVGLPCHLTDGTPHVATRNVEYSEVTYSRTFKSSSVDHWQALFVPINFTINDYTDQFDIAAIYAVCPTQDTNGNGYLDSGDELRMILSPITTGEALANVPYMIRPKEAKEYTILSNDNYVYKAESHDVEFSTAFAQYTISGTHQSMVCTPGDQNYYVTASGSMSYAATKDITLGANRWYMHEEARAYAGVGTTTAVESKEVKICVIGEDLNETDAIQLVQTSTERTDATYSISGMQVSNGNLAPGIYVRNGKKFIVK